MLKKLDRLSAFQKLVLYILLDLLCLGAGMGVPFFCILLGLPVGWYGAQKLVVDPTNLNAQLRQILRLGLVTSGLTKIGMILIWVPALRLLFRADFDLANFGMPLVLFEPRASFIGWIVLMVVISPFLQLLMTVFGAHLRLILERKSLA